VGVGIYTALTKPISGKVDDAIIEPLNPTLDKSVFDELGQRIKIETVPIEITSDNPEATPSAPVDVTINTGTENELTN
jgi:hypothetical protein